MAEEAPDWVRMFRPTTLVEEVQLLVSNSRASGNLGSFPSSTTTWDDSETPTIVGGLKLGKWDGCFERPSFRL